MRTLVVGDVHGCREELAELVTAAAPDRVILVGDLFRKGPDPAGVWRLIRDHGFGSVLGNHDARLLDHLAGDPDPESARCAALLDAEDPGWRTWLAALPLYADAGPFLVVHAGLHPSGSLAATTRRMAISLRRWPDEAPGDPFWWQIYTGEPRVIFGHDAVRGLVRVERNGLPWLIGLDTGCVYGGALSGYLVEDDRIVQVRARAVHRAPEPWPR